MDESCATTCESKSGIEPGCRPDEANVAHDRVERDSIKAEQVQELAVALETEWTPEGILEQHEITRMAVLLWHLARAKDVSRKARILRALIENSLDRLEELKARKRRLRLCYPTRAGRLQSFSRT